MRADDWSMVDPLACGRDSICISLQNAYGESIIVLDLTHIPAGCATWPAFWTNSQKGPWQHGLMVGKLTSSKACFLSLSSPSWLIHTHSLCVLLPLQGGYERVFGQVGVV